MPWKIWAVVLLWNVCLVGFVQRHSAEQGNGKKRTIQSRPGRQTWTSSHDFIWILFHIPTSFWSPLRKQPPTTSMLAQYVTCWRFSFMSCFRSGQTYLRLWWPMLASCWRTARNDSSIATIHSDFSFSMMTCMLNGWTLLKLFFQLGTYCLISLGMSQWESLLGYEQAYYITTPFSMVNIPGPRQDKQHLTLDRFGLSAWGW